MTRAGLRWTAAALLGIAVTVVLTWSVSQLTGQRIGLSSEPASALNGLAPRKAELLPQRHSKPSGAPRATTTVTSPATTTATVAPPTTTITSLPPATSPPAAPTTRSSGQSHRDDSGGSGGSGRDD